MEAERSLVLQKKTVLFLSLIITTLFILIYGREVNFKESKVNFSNVNIVTQNLENDENEIVKENKKYMAKKIAYSGEELNVSFINNEKIETFAGDVLNLVDEKENEVVANIESTKNEAITESVYEIIKEDKNEEKISNKEEQNQEKKENKNVVKYKELREDNPPSEYIKTIEVKATAYCLCKKCCGKNPDSPNYGKTSSGIKIIPGTGMKVIAVDPNVIPLNSKVYVEGLNGAWDYGTAIAADTGSAIKNNKIDLYMDTHKEALEWGRKTVKVYVLGE